MSPLNRTRGDSGSGLQSTSAMQRVPRKQRGRRYVAVISPAQLDAVECSNRGADVDKRPTPPFRPELKSWEQRHGSCGSDPTIGHRLCGRAIRSTYRDRDQMGRYGTRRGTIPWSVMAVALQWATDRPSVELPGIGTRVHSIPYRFSVRSSLCLCSDLPVTRTSR